MHRVLLIQLPIPQLSFGLKTGNIPLAAACLHQAADHLPDMQITVMAQNSATCMGDAALLDLILQHCPDTIGFTTYMWNVMRVRYLSREIKRHYSPRIVVGGPEVTPDNPLLRESAIDFRVYGEGEHLFVRLIQEPDLWFRHSGQSEFDRSFTALPNPYLTAPLDYRIENTMLLETMRGCPYSCTYCYYSKSRCRPIFKADGLILDALTWALDRGIAEIYLLDPSLNVRPGLKRLLKQIATLNKNHKLSLISEIRADHIDEETAALFAAAGFSGFEIGLQSTHPEALECINRPTDVERFVQGVSYLKQRGIKTTIDLIVGLPGDNPAGFHRSVQFMVDHAMVDDIQIFPLSVLPGTELRRNRHALGLKHMDEPPYTVISTPQFSQDQIRAALAYAEERFDISLYPLPDVDIAWQTTDATAIGNAPDVTVSVNGRSMLRKVIVRKDRTGVDLAAAARRVTHPYQLLFAPDISKEHSAQAISIFSQTNPHTPFELVFFAPRELPDVTGLLAATRLARPHYLDGHLRELGDLPGNRAVLFTVLSPDMENKFSGPMQRHIHWWHRPHLPDRSELDRLEQQGFDGILIDMDAASESVGLWQDQMVPIADDLFLIGFARRQLQKRWLEKTAAAAYCFPLFS